MYGQHVKAGNLEAPTHGLVSKHGNKALSDNLKNMAIYWFVSLANDIGESSAVKIHRRRKVNNVVEKYTNELGVIFFAHHLHERVNLLGIQ